MGSYSNSNARIVVQLLQTSLGPLEDDLFGWGSIVESRRIGAVVNRNKMSFCGQLTQMQHDPKQISY